MAERALLTYDVLLEMYPEEDNVQRELLDGELVVSPNPKTRHQLIVMRLASTFFSHVSERAGGVVLAPAVDVILSPSTVVQPDLMFVSDDQMEVLNDRNAVGSPALMVEIVSDSRRDRVRKRDLYERFGVAEYWIVDPDADRIEVYRHDGTGYGKPAIFEPGETLLYDKLPGLAIDLTALLAR